MKFKKRSYAIKYCGGCHPQYDRVLECKKLELALGCILLPAEQGHRYDIIFVFNGCRSGCADISGLLSEQIISFDSFQDVDGYVDTL